MKQPIAGIAAISRGLPKRNGKPSKQESHALDREYRLQRNLALQLKNRGEQMLSAKARGELVEKRSVEIQASFLLMAMRRRALALPQALCNRLATVADPSRSRRFSMRRCADCLPRCGICRTASTRRSGRSSLPRKKATAPRSPGAASRSDWLDIGPLPALVISRPAQFEASMSLPTGCLHVRNAQNP